MSNYSILVVYVDRLKRRFRNLPFPDVVNSRSDEGDVTEEIDDDGFITVRTKKEKRAIKYSNTVERNRSESNTCKSVSRVILLKQSS
jgi:hypothetical protein